MNSINNNIFNKYVSIVYLFTYVWFHHVRIGIRIWYLTCTPKANQTSFLNGSPIHVKLFMFLRRNSLVFHRYARPLNQIASNTIDSSSAFTGRTDTTSFLVDWIIKLHQGAYSTLKLTQFVNTITFNTTISYMCAVWTFEFSRGCRTTNYNSNNGRTWFELCNIETKSPINMIEP